MAEDTFDFDNPEAEESMSFDDEEEMDFDTADVVFSTTGIPKLDALLMNGIPRGFTILIEGTPGAGMELFAKQFSGNSEENENVLYIATNETTADIIYTMDNYGWNNQIDIFNVSSEYYDKVLFKELQAIRLKREGVSIEDFEAGRLAENQDDFKSIDFLADIVYRISLLKPPFRVVIDSIDFFLEQYGDEAVLSALRTIKTHTQKNNGLTLVTMVSNSHSQRVESGIRSIVDTIIELTVTQVASEFENRLIIRKVRNRPDKTSVLTYAITEGGITPERISRIV